MIFLHSVSIYNLEIKTVSICHGCSGHQTQWHIVQRQTKRPVRASLLHFTVLALEDFILKPEYLHNLHFLGGDRLYYLSRILVCFIWEARLPGQRTSLTQPPLAIPAVIKYRTDCFKFSFYIKHSFVMFGLLRTF